MDICLRWRSESCRNKGHRGRPGRWTSQVSVTELCDEIQKHVERLQRNEKREAKELNEWKGLAEAEVLLMMLMMIPAGLENDSLIIRSKFSEKNNFAISFISL